MRRYAPHVVLGVGVLIVYVSSPVKTPFDSRWVIPTAISVLREGNVALDEYAETYVGTGEAVTPGSNGHVYTSFPMAVPLAALPPLAVFQGLARVGCPAASVIPRLRDHCERWLGYYDKTGAIDPDFHDTTQLIIASLMVAIAAAIFFEVARLRTGTTTAALVALLFAFGTSAWSTASRALWQHGPSILALCIALLGIARADAGKGTVRWVGAVLAAAFAIRPTNAVPAAAFGIYVLVRHRRDVPWFAAGALAVAGAWCALNLSTYGTVLPGYFLPVRVGGSTSTFWEALAGNMVSPNRGLLVFTPFLLVVLWSVAGRIATRRFDALEWTLLAVIGLHWIVVSRFPHWWAGHSFGPRFLTDMAPFLCFLAIPAVEQGQRGGFMRVALGATAALSIAIHARGSISWGPHEWNGSPVSVDYCSQRVWDWSDLQFLRQRRVVPPAPGYCAAVN